MKKYFGLQALTGMVFLMIASVPAMGSQYQSWQDEEADFFRKISKVCPACGEALGNLAAAYTTKCGLAPSKAQMKLIVEEDPAYLRALAMLAVSNDQMRGERAIGSNPPISFTAYMQAIAGVICR